MKPICAICGRRTMPAVFIGTEAVGPTCAKKIGLSKKMAPKNSKLRFATYKQPRTVADVNLELFPELT